MRGEFHHLLSPAEPSQPTFYSTMITHPAAVLCAYTSRGPDAHDRPALFQVQARYLIDPSGTSLTSTIPIPPHSNFHVSHSPPIIQLPHSAPKRIRATSFAHSLARIACTPVSSPMTGKSNEGLRDMIVRLTRLAAGRWRMAPKSKIAVLAAARRPKAG